MAENFSSSTISGAHERSKSISKGKPQSSPGKPQATPGKPHPHPGKLQACPGPSPKKPHPPACTSVAPACTSTTTATPRKNSSHKVTGTARVVKHAPARDLVVPTAFLGRTKRTRRAPVRYGVEGRVVLGAPASSAPAKTVKKKVAVKACDAGKTIKKQSKPVCNGGAAPACGGQTRCG